jgi:hypothetical protein
MLKLADGERKGSNDKWKLARRKRSDWRKN